MLRSAFPGTASPFVHCNALAPASPPGTQRCSWEICDEESTAVAWYQVIVITKRISYQGIDICNCISYMFISNICIYLIKDMYTSNTHTHIYIYVCDVCMYVYIYIQGMYLCMLSQNMGYIPNDGKTANNIRNTIDV